MPHAPVTGPAANLAAALAGENGSDAATLGAIFREARMARADMEFADLAGADFTGADLSMARVGGANLEGADVAGAFFVNADLASARLKGLRNADAAALARARNLDRALCD